MTTDELIQAQSALIASQQRIIELLAVELRLRANPPVFVPTDTQTPCPWFTPGEVTT